MRRIAVGAVVAALFAAPAFALEASEIDTLGESLITPTKIMGVYPALAEGGSVKLDASDRKIVSEKGGLAESKPELIEVSAT